MGGVLGLCTGFSLLTAVELIYWFTVRLVNDYFDRKKISSQSSHEKEPNSECEKEKNEFKKRIDLLDTKVVNVRELLDSRIEDRNTKVEVKITQMEKQMAQMEAKMFDELKSLKDLLTKRRFRSVADSQ